MSVIDVNAITKHFFKNRKLVESHLLKSLFSFNTSKKKNFEPENMVAALSDVSFKVQKGEVFGVIGQNGSGKSTLMKVLANLLKPESGSVKVRGNVQAMINLKAGFNNVLTGRQNVLNALILRGFEGKVLESKLEEIVSFAEVGEFIDSPISMYSSGMAAKLGFSLAVCSEPEIFIIDEALSVGDEVFKNKCLVKVQELKQNGVTIILVSHSMNQVLMFCDKVLWLDKGKTKMIGDPRNVVSEYLKSATEKSKKYSQPSKAKENKKDQNDDQEEITQSNKDAEGKDPLSQDFEFIDHQNNIVTDFIERDSIYRELYGASHKLKDISFDPASSSSNPLEFSPHDRVQFKVQVTVTEVIDEFSASLNIYREDGRLMTTISTINKYWKLDCSPSVITLEYDIEHICLNPGNYVVVLPLHEGRSYLFRGIVAKMTIKSEGSFFWGEYTPKHNLTLTRNPS